MTQGKGDKFEHLLKKLEEAVHKLEEGELSLDDSLETFTEGMKLVKLCEERLHEAEKKIEILMKSRDEQKKPVPFEVEES